MAWFVVPIIVLLLLLVIGIALGVTGGLGKSVAVGKVDPHAEAEKGPSLRYLVPDGQDPAVVLTALKEAGYDAVPDRGPYEQVVVIPLEQDTAETREDVREAISRARATNIEGPPVLDPTPVRFEGEAPQA